MQCRTRQTTPTLRSVDAERPLHVFGIGLPDLVKELFARGVDSVDSSNYVRAAGDGKRLAANSAPADKSMDAIACKCAACRRDSPLVTEADIQELKPQVPDWTLVNRDGILRLERTFTTKDFVEALSFTNRIGDLAEAEGHHPAILTEWGRVTVTWWTHKIRGLHRNDVIMAARTDEAAG